MIPLTWDTYNSQRIKEWNSWQFYESWGKKGNGQLLINRQDGSVKQRWISLVIHYTSLSLWFPIMACTHKHLVSREISYQLFLSQWNKNLKRNWRKSKFVEFKIRWMFKIYWSSSSNRNQKINIEVVTDDTRK